MKIIFFLLLIASLSACQKPDNDAINIISEQNFILLLADLHTIQEQSQSLRGSYPQHANIVYERLQADVFAAHHTDSSQYAASQKYYTARFQTFENIYQAVTDTLTARKARAAAQ
jgi:archaellum biogenesis protein FlaJ (TadC family)